MFTSLAAVRAHTGLVPKIRQSGVSEVESSITTAGVPLLREMVRTAADQARKVDPQIAAKWQRLRDGDDPEERQSFGVVVMIDLWRGTAARLDRVVVGYGTQVFQRSSWISCNRWSSRSPRKRSSCRSAASSCRR